MIGINRLVLITAATGLVSMLVFCGNGSPTGSDPLLLNLTQTLDREHYHAPELNDDFSGHAYQAVLDNLDRDKQFFTVEDIKALSVHEKAIDDQIRMGSFAFFDSAWSRLQNRLNAIEPWVDQTLSKPFDYQTKASWTEYEKVPDYAKNEAGLRKHWDLWLQFQTVDRLYRKQESQKGVNPVQEDPELEAIDGQTPESALDKSDRILPFDSLELKSRNETAKFIHDWFKRWRGMDRKDQVSFYLNSLCQVYDPHTNYYAPEDKENFDISMTGKLEGIGATLSERDGYVKVERIVPGSASYKQGDLKAGDLILKVAQGKDEAVDIVGMKLDEAIKLIRGKKGTEVRLTVKKPDGLIQEIPIIREVVVIEESYARSLVFEFKGHKLGLIQLPSFYADFSARGRGRNCTGDVQAEIEKLQQAGAEGIVLDLRNNGGGSLADAIEMSGLFIPSGPIVQVRFPNGGVQQAADPDPSVQYNDPLVILTNTYSASASEILAAALQDYGRAIIVGSKSTFGKGTVQTFVPLEGSGNAVFPDGFGQVKVTIQKFYRINGGTTQLVGVVPDVILPDLYDEVERGEKEMDFHLEYDKIRPAAYRAYAGTHGSGKGLAINQAHARVADGEYYQLIRERSKQLGAQRAQYEYPLNLKSYSALQQDWQLQAKKVSDYPYQTVVDSLYALPVDLAAAQGDEAKLAVKTDWIKRYKKDVGIDEAAQILSDWLGL